MNVVGIDLSGPRNVADTAMVLFRQEGPALQFLQGIDGFNDRQIYDAIRRLGKAERIVVGIDAPLSYNPGGGDRASDQQLRRVVHEHGGGPRVMPPTMIRMVYLTLRGVALTRTLEKLRPEFDLGLVEVHPGASMLLRGAARENVTGFKRQPEVRAALLDWLASQGLGSIPREEPVTDHFVAACGAALAAWKWSANEAAWCFPAQPPDHPYDFAC